MFYIVLQNRMEIYNDLSKAHDKEEKVGEILPRLVNVVFTLLLPPEISDYCAVFNEKTKIVLMLISCYRC